MSNRAENEFLHAKRKNVAQKTDNDEQTKKIAYPNINLRSENKNLR